MATPEWRVEMIEVADDPVAISQGVKEGTIAAPVRPSCDEFSPE
jgi:hypothetical protein